jgi:CheY-like chemotaxis protein
LVIDDHKDTADSLAACLRSVGHQVEVAYQGVAGIETARRFKPDVVLCDIVLPGIDGYYVAGALKDDSELSPCYFIAVSGQAPHPTRSRVFSEYLRKPIEPGVLLAAVGRAAPAAAPSS